jgi:hypothetical protein
LRPVEIVNDKQIDTIAGYLDLINVNLLSKSAVPLAYDWGCNNGKASCSKVFRSFNDALSKDVTDDLLERMDDMNLMNKPFSWVGKKIDSIGIGLSKTKLMYFDL